MKNVLFIISFLFISFSTFAQDYELSGTVYYGDFPLQGAAVKVKNSSHATTSDANGHYSLMMEEGTYQVEFIFGNRKQIEVVLTDNQVLNVDLGDAEEVLKEVFVSAIRVNAQSPITYSNLSGEEIENRNLGQDIPSLLNYLPGVVTTSDAGAGIGYTGIRVRGSDASRVNVTINGIPYNDSESHGTFWVNLGDFASSVESLQLQRGVGTSTNGAGAFGASLNVMTDTYQVNPSAEISNSVGSYGTRKHTVKFSTGLFDERWEFSGRASHITSDGYIDRASTDLNSYFLQGTYVYDKTIIKALTFGGNEVTYQAWDGIEADQLKENRRFNPAGAYEDDNGNPQFYDRHVDEYQQDHYQLLWNQGYNGGWSSNLALHYTKGYGFYESYRAGEDLEEYGMDPVIVEGVEIGSSDLVTIKGLDNYFYGSTFNVSYEEDNFDVILGGALNKYKGDHFGRITYARSVPLQKSNRPYYDNVADKSEFNFFAKTNIALTEDLTLFGDLQLRNINYTTTGFMEEQVPLEIDDTHTFFNPKAGLSYQLNRGNRFYFSFARANREPNRDDYQSGNPEHEELNDYELGWRFNTKNIQVNSNLYLMDYHNQLVLTGQLDNTGAFLRRNSGNSYRMGLEIDAAFRISEKLSIKPNIALSQNKNIDYIDSWNGELTNFGKTDISYSPEIVAANIIEYRPWPSFEVRFLSKYVGEQFMSNMEAPGSKLDAYFVNDLNLQYTWDTAPLFKEVIFTGLVNNIFNELYVSNGYYYTYDVPVDNSPDQVETYYGAGYYPQAETNFLLGMTLKF